MVTHLLRFRLRRETVDWSSHAAIVKFRQECEEGARRFGKIPAGIDVSPVTIDGIPAEWILPSGATRDRIIFFLHGGGYVSGSCADHRIHAAKLVKGTGLAALLFEYRLAPEHPYPAAIEDSLTAYQWLLGQGVSPSDIVFAGDSAGGGLALALLPAVRDRGMPLPAAAAVMSPWTDLMCTGESYRTKANVCLSPEGTWTAFSKHYAADNDPCLPLISPLYGDLHGLPPILIHVGEDEILRDDSIRFAEKAKEAGVDVTLRVGEGMLHCYPVCAPLFPEATAAMEEICNFMRMHLRC
jgi:epsilon-lactone hydrolase